MAICVFLMAFALYAWTTSPSIGWLDASEMVAASASLGVSHSPGHPVPPLIGYFTSLFPLGDLTFRINLASALCSSIAAVFIYATMKILLEKIVSPNAESQANTTSSTMAALGTTAAICVSGGVWMSSTRAEVYALQNLLLSGALYYFLQYIVHNKKSSYLYITCLLCGLAIANHYVIAIALVAAIAAWFVIVDKGLTKRRSIKTLTGIFLFGAMGLASYLYVPVRASQHPLVNWADPHTWDRLLWTLSGKAFHKAIGGELASSSQNTFQDTLLGLVYDAGPMMILLGIIGTILVLSHRKSRKAGLFLFSIAAINTALRAILGFNRVFPDHFAYLFLANLVVAMLAGVAIAAMARWITQRASSPIFGYSTIVIVCVFVVGTQLLIHGPKANQRNAYGSDDVARWEWQGLPQDSLVIPGYHLTSFRRWALASTEDFRPDIAVIERSFLTYPGWQQMTIDQYPELKQTIRAIDNANQPLPLRELQNVSAQRPVYVQPHMTIDNPTLRLLTPQGAFSSVRTASPSVTTYDPDYDAKKQEEWKQILRHLQPSDLSELTFSDLWYQWMRIRSFCNKNKLLAQQALEQALTIDATSSKLQKLADQCSLTLPKK